MAKERRRPERERPQPSFVRRSWKWLSGVLLAALAAVIAGYVADANHWFWHEVGHSSAALSVVVTMKSPSRECEGQKGWVFAEKPSVLPVPPLGSSSAADEWASRNGGIPASGNFVTAVLQPPSNKTVVVTDIRVEVVGRHRSRAGTHPILGGGCGGLEPMHFKANLDRSPVRAVPTAGVSASGKRIPPVPLPHTLSEQRPEDWQIAAVTTTCDCDWVAYVDYTADGHPGESKIDDHGKPFRVAGLQHVVRVFPDYSQRKWQVLGSG